jgi:hypothetical protein
MLIGSPIPLTSDRSEAIRLSNWIAARLRTPAMTAAAHLEVGKVGSATRSQARTRAKDGGECSRMFAVTAAKPSNRSEPTGERTRGAAFGCVSFVSFARNRTAHPQAWITKGGL